MLQYACHTAILVKGPCDPWKHEIGLDNDMDITWLEPHHQTEKPFISATKVHHCDAISDFMVCRHQKIKKRQGVTELESMWGRKHPAWWENNCSAVAALHVSTRPTWSWQTATSRGMCHARGGWGRTKHEHGNGAGICKHTCHSCNCLTRQSL